MITIGNQLYADSLYSGNFSTTDSQYNDMLQFVTGKPDKYSVAEQAQMAIEGGVRWVIFNPVDMTDEAVRDALAELVPLCKETDTILTITDHVEAAREMKIHGVQLSVANRAVAVREELGPEAIIGVTVGGAEGIESLRGKDMDYFVLPEDCSLQGMSQIVDRVRSAGDMSAIVARGNLDIAELDVIKATGVSGVQLSGAILDAPDPVEATQRAMRELSIKN